MSKNNYFLVLGFHMIIERVMEHLKNFVKFIKQLTFYFKKNISLMNKYMVENMIDKNINYVKYFLRIIKEFDESTVLNPDLNGKETPSLNTEELNINKDALVDFCQKNSINESSLF